MQLRSHCDLPSCRSALVSPWPIQLDGLAAESLHFHAYMIDSSAQAPHCILLFPSLHTTHASLTRPAAASICHASSSLSSLSIHRRRSKMAHATTESLRNNFDVTDYTIFILFLVCSALIGVYFGWKGRKNKSNKDFLTGNRNLPIFPVVMSLAASFMSTNTILGVPAEVYTLGTQFYISMTSFMIAVILSAEVFMPVFYELNMTSVNEYLFLRFKSHKARLCGSLAFLMCTVSTLVDQAEQLPL